MIGHAPDEQLELLPSAPPESRRAALLVSDLTGFEQAAPNQELVDQIARLGLLQPVAAAKELPTGLFADRDTPWQVTVRGHLQAAREAIPESESDGGLAELLNRAAALLETDREAYGGHSARP